MGSLQNFGITGTSPGANSELAAFTTLISSIQLTTEPDGVRWRWDRGGRFSARSAYNFLVFDAVDDNRVKHLWSIKIPPKVKIFLWIAARNRLLTADNLAKRGWIGPSVCCLCGRASENLEHLFFQCSFASHVWNQILHGEHFVIGALLAQDGSLATRF